MELYGKEYATPNVPLWLLMNADYLLFAAWITFRYLPSPKKQQQLRQQPQTKKKQ